MMDKERHGHGNAYTFFRYFIYEMVEAYGTYDDRYPQGGIHKPSLNSVAAEFDITALKARKLLITAGAFSTETSRRVADLHAAGYSIPQIMEVTGLKRASVHSYLPYTKIPYNLSEASANAERIRRYRERKAALDAYFVGTATTEPYMELDDTGNWYQYWYRKKKINTEGVKGNILVLFQYHAEIVACGELTHVIVSENGKNYPDLCGREVHYEGHYDFDVNTLKLLQNPIGLSELNEAAPEITQFGQGAQKIDMSHLADVLRLLVNAM